jgi:inner membrane transporter RhtA
VDQSWILRLDVVDAVNTRSTHGAPVGHGQGTRSRWLGVATMLTGATSNQVGAAIGAHAFDAIAPLGVVAVRQLVAATVLLPACSRR